MENLDNLIPLMISQHRALQKDLGEALSLANDGSSQADKIEVAFKNFSADLIEHLHMENDIFYPELLSAMKNKSLDISKTEEFIKEMQKIGAVVTEFLKKYRESKNIISQFDFFKKELIDIINALNLRIESEEAGVYSYWALYKQ